MNKGSKQSGSLWKAPIRILSKARDFYIKSFSDCAGRFEINPGLGCPIVHVSTLPRSFSGNTSTRSYTSIRQEDDFSELLRISSARGLNKKVETEFLRRQKSLPTMTGGNGNGGVIKVMGRSQSLAIERIDEDKECDFGDDVKVKADVAFTKSLSHSTISSTKLR